KRDVDKLDKVVLESGDILIFGGKSRNVYHGVKAIILNSAPEALLKESMLRPGRIGPGGFGQPGYEDGRKLQLQMLCLGRYWDPQTRYSKGYGFKVPDKFISLVETALEDSKTFINSEDELPWMSLNISIVNFYTATDRLGIHQDRDDSWGSINKVVLESGDILIFGGKSRNVYHGVKAIILNSAPEALLKESMLRPGRLNLTFRQY
nr:oxoglutarate/iron-dependent dioxygenase [Tanacetum cinerariifolium]